MEKIDESKMIFRKKEQKGTTYKSSGGFKSNKV